MLRNKLAIKGFLMNFYDVIIICKESGFYASTVVLAMHMLSLEQNPLDLETIVLLVALDGIKTKSLHLQLEKTHLRF